MEVKRKDDKLGEADLKAKKLEEQLKDRADRALGDDTDSSLRLSTLYTTLRHPPRTSDPRVQTVQI